MRFSSDLAATCGGPSKDTSGFAKLLERCLTLGPGTVGPRVPGFFA